jgi:O2-independent ubiquinone biosynthesis accessory factor UbiT
MSGPAGNRQRQLLRSLPGQLLWPIGLLPRRFSHYGFIVLCNQLFATALAAGDLTFLDRRVVSIGVKDARVDLALSLESGRLIAPAPTQRVDVSIRSSAYDLLLLASGHEDADTLFFQRRLRLEGNTELGLHLKNFLDAWEPPPGIWFFQQVAGAYLNRAER